jgi:hypothetical protein
MSSARAVLGAMLLGDRLLLDDDTNALLRDAGLVHILSISGLHTALTVLLLLAMLRRVGLGPRSLLFVGGGGLLAFAAFVVTEPPCGELAPARRWGCSPGGSPATSSRLRPWRSPRGCWSSPSRRSRTAPASC